LFKGRAAGVIEKRHGYTVILVADQVELTPKRDSIMARCKGAVQGFGFAAPYFPVGNKLGNVALTALAHLLQLLFTKERKMPISS
jgi:hypothetical protein